MLLSFYHKIIHKYIISTISVVLFIYIQISTGLVQMQI